MMYIPKVVYNGNTLEFTFSQKLWLPASRMVGGGDTAAIGHPWHYWFRHDYLLDVTVIFPYAMWPQVDAWIAWAQRTGESFEFWMDKNDDDTKGIYYLDRPGPIDEVRPSRHEYKPYLELDLTFRQYDEIGIIDPIVGQPDPDPDPDPDPEYCRLEGPFLFHEDHTSYADINALIDEYGMTPKYYSINTPMPNTILDTVNTYQGLPVVASEATTAAPWQGHNWMCYVADDDWNELEPTQISFRMHIKFEDTFNITDDPTPTLGEGFGLALFNLDQSVGSVPDTWAWTMIRGDGIYLVISSHDGVGFQYNGKKICEVADLCDGTWKDVEFVGEYADGNLTIWALWGDPCGSRQVDSFSYPLTGTTWYFERIELCSPWGAHWGDNAGGKYWVGEWGVKIGNDVTIPT